MNQCADGLKTKAVAERLWLDPEPTSGQVFAIHEYVRGSSIAHVSHSQQQRSFAVGKRTHRDDDEVYSQTTIKKIIYIGVCTHHACLFNMGPNMCFDAESNYSGREQ